MEIKIKVFAKAGKNKVLDEKGHLNIYVRADKKNFEANKAVVELLAKHFKTDASKINLKQGKTSQYKIVEIL